MAKKRDEEYLEYHYIWDIQETSDPKIAVNIIRDMRIMLTRPKVLSKSLGALWKLSTPEANRDYLTNIGAGQAVIDVMTAYSKDVKLLRLACGVLKNLGGNLLVLEKMGAGDCVMNSLRRFMKDKELVEQACSAIRNLGQYKQNAESLVKRSVSPLILEAMELHMNSPDTLKRACAALWSLSTAPECKETMWQEGVCQGVVAVMRKYPNEQRLQENSLGLLWTIGYHYSLMRIGGGEVVLEAMKRHPRVQQIVLYGTYLLKNLGSIRSNAIELVAMESAETLMTSILSLQSVASIQENGCSAFWSLSLWQETKMILLQKGVGSFILNLLSNPNKEVKIFNSAISVLTNLSAVEGNGEFFDRKQAGLAVLSGMAQFNSNETAVEKSIFCLRNLFFWDIPGLLEIQAEQAVKGAIQKYPRNNTIKSKGGEILDKLRN